jgi:hypothetical protein
VRVTRKGHGGGGEINTKYPNKRAKEKKGSMRSKEKLFIGKKARVGRREREA